MGCNSARDSFVVTVITTTLSDALVNLEFPSVQLFPSPLLNGQQLNVKIQGITAVNEPIMISLYTIQGQVLQSQTLQTNGADALLHSFHFTQNPSPGIYLLEAKYNGQVRFFKWTVE